MEEKYKIFEQKLIKLEKANEQLLTRICELEDQQGDLNDQIKKLQLKNENLEKEIQTIKNKSEEIQESWLFYCEKKRTLNSIKKTLEFESDIAKEFDYMTWINEETMWKQIAASLKQEIIKDAEKMNKQQLKALATQCLKEKIDNEVLFVLRNLPKEPIKMNELIELCALFTQIWYEIELGGDECTGRILLVIESEINLDKLELMRPDNSKVILQIEKLVN